MHMNTIVNFELQSIFNLFNSIPFHVHAIIGAFVIWVFSWLWHDFIIVKPWLKWTGMSLEEAQGLHENKLIQDLGLYLLCKLILSYAIMVLAYLFQVQSLIQAMLFSAILSFGVIFPMGVGPVIFENRSAGLWVLSSTLISISVTFLALIKLF